MRSPLTWIHNRSHPSVKLDCLSLEAFTFPFSLNLLKRQKGLGPVPKSAREQERPPLLDMTFESGVGSVTPQSGVPQKRTLCGFSPSRVLFSEPLLFLTGALGDCGCWYGVLWISTNAYVSQLFYRSSEPKAPT